MKNLKSFPKDFITTSESDEITVPYRSLMPGTEMFGKFEVISVAGEHVCFTDCYETAKYIVYSARNSSGKVLLPKDYDIIKNSIKEYEEYLDGLLKEIAADYRKNFPGNGNLNSVSGEIFKSSSLIRY